MAKKWQKVSAGVLTAVLATSAVVLAPGCGDTLVVNIDPVDGIDYTYRTYTSVSPSNWNELTYQDSNDRQILSYLGSAFTEFDYNFDDNGNVIEDGSFQVKYSAATKLEDVTASVDAKWGYTETQKESGGYAWKFTLRDDLKWDDGTAIKAEDFVYTMQEQLNPLFKNYGAQNYYSGNYIFRNAKEYVYQGSSGKYDATMVTTTTAYGNQDDYKMYDVTKIYPMDSDLIFTLTYDEDSGSSSYIVSWCLSALSASLSDYDTPDECWGDVMYVLDYYLDYYGIVDLDNMDESDKTARTDLIKSMEGKTFKEIKNNEQMRIIFGQFLKFWQSDPGEEIHFAITDYTWPEVNFDNVGIYAPSDYELVIILDTQLNLIDEKGKLTYEAAYYMSSLPLVKKSLYEQCKKSPVSGSTLWTSTYNSSVATTASWGPYKLVEFQAGRYYELRRNEYWYGYTDADNDGVYDMYPNQYQTDRICCDTVKSYNTAWQMFQKGGLDAIGIDVTIASDYKDSGSAYFTPDDFIQSMHLQSTAAALKKYESGNRDNRLLANVKFRQALSLAIDRADYAATCTTSSKAGFGFFNTMHYYDVANGGLYRNTTVAKEALLRAYGYEENNEGKWSINGGTAMDIDDAIDSMTGYNLTLARQLVNEAIAEEIKAGNWEADAVLKLIWGSSTDNESTRRHYNYQKKAFETLFEGTNLAGFELTFDASFGDNWADDFRDNGKYDICSGGWTGGAWNPYYFIGAYIMDANRYAKGWNPRQCFVKFTVDGTEYEKDVYTWYEILNDAEGKSWDTDTRLALVAKLEETILKTYWSIPVINSYAASLITYKCDYISYEYNQFMGYGGIQYMSYNYTDAEWKDFVTEKGTLNYKGDRD